MVLRQPLTLVAPDPLTWKGKLKSKLIVLLPKGVWLYKCAQCAYVEYCYQNFADTPGGLLCGSNSL
jgi:hypothetical protein